MPEPLHLTRILPGHEATSTALQRLLEHLSAPGAPRPLAFEIWATDAGIHYFVGRADSGKPTLRTLLRAHFPGSRTLRDARPDAPERVARLKLTPRAMPLRADALEPVLHALYSVYSGRRKSEVIALQVVLGRGYRPAQLPAKILDPAPSFGQLLLRGTSPAPSETRSRIAKQLGVARVAVTIRIGVTAAVPERRQQLRGQLLAALEQLEAPGAQLSLMSDTTAHWQRATLGWSQIPVTASQLTSLVGWPVDELELPGLPPRHPRLLPPPAGITKDAGPFATATAPGVEHAVGLAPAARLQHLAVTGGTGSGKSQIFASLALDDIAARRPLVLIEPKRQLVDQILDRAPKDAAGRIVVIDAADANPVGFNPLDMGDRDPGPVIDGVLEVFKAVFEDGWGPRTEDLLLAGLASLDANGRRRGTPHTLLDLPKLLSDDGYRRSVIGAVADDPTLGAYWATFQNHSPAQRANIIAAPMNKLRKFLLRKNVAAILGQSQPRFRLRDVFRGEPLAVLVPLNDALIGPGASQLLGGLIVAEIWLATQERAAETDPQAKPGMVFIDELQRYMHLPTSIDDALATSRSYGVGWHLAAQGRAQLPRSMALALELNARNQVTFAASPTDATALTKTTNKLTAEDFQELDKYEIYANLVIDGAPAGWFSARTLAPSPSAGHAEYIRAANRERFAGDSAPEQSAASVAAPGIPATGSVESEPPLRSTRKWRSS